MPSSRRSMASFHHHPVRRAEGPDRGLEHRLVRDDGEHHPGPGGVRGHDPVLQPGAPGDDERTPCSACWTASRPLTGSAPRSPGHRDTRPPSTTSTSTPCLLYTSDAADDLL